MAANGGLMLGQAWYDKDSPTEHRFAMLWGLVATKPKEQLYSKKGRVDFLVKYHRASFIICHAYGDGPVSDIAFSLNRGDEVVVFGEYRSYKYTTKNGLTKEKYEIAAHQIVPTTTLVGLIELKRSGAADRIVEQFGNTEADTVEDEVIGYPDDDDAPADPSLFGVDEEMDYLEDDGEFEDIDGLNL